MQENKKDIKEENVEHVKIYDKDMYVSQEKFKTIVLIIVAFLIGFVAGYFSKDMIKAENADNSNNNTYNSQIENIE